MIEIGAIKKVNLYDPENLVKSAVLIEEHGIYYPKTKQFRRRESGGTAFGTSGVPAVRLVFENRGGCLG